MFSKDVEEPTVEVNNTGLPPKMQKILKSAAIKKVRMTPRIMYLSKTMKLETMSQHARDVLLGSLCS
jgi:hypothetical protein